jgi:DNA-binding XRE family transcriptional regulator
VRGYTISRLAGDLDVDVTQVGRWARGDWRPSITRAIAVCELARAAGVDLTLEDLYSRDVQRIRYRIRNQLPPI